MNNALTVPQAVEVLETLCSEMIQAKDHFNELDAVAGDGDMGISVSRGFEAVRQGLGDHPDDVGRILTQAGITFSDAAASTIGALFSTALLRAGKEVQGAKEIGLREIVRMGQAAEKGIRDRGKAGLGNKTLLDALAPAIDALAQSMDQGQSLVQALDQAAAAAEQGMVATADMVPVVGRARWLPERSQGHQDPGAIAMHAIFRSVATSVRRMLEA